MAYHSTQAPVVMRVANLLLHLSPTIFHPFCFWKTHKETERSDYCCIPLSLRVVLVELSTTKNDKDVLPSTEWLEYFRECT